MINGKLFLEGVYQSILSDQERKAKSQDRIKTISYSVGLGIAGIILVIVLKGIL